MKEAGLMKKRLMIGMATLSAAFMLSGCGEVSAFFLEEAPRGTSSTKEPSHDRESTPAGDVHSPRTNVFVQELPDGREITCIFAKEVHSSGSGLSCDWNPEPEEK